MNLWRIFVPLGIVNFLSFVSIKIKSMTKEIFLKAIFKENSHEQVLFTAFNHFSTILRFSKVGFMIITFDSLN